MTKLDDLMDRVLVFVDRNGSLLVKDNNPMYCSIEMQYFHKGTNITMSVYSHCQGNGSCSAKVIHKGKVVFDASGCYTSSPFKVKADIYIPGDWERLDFPSREDIIRKSPKFKAIQKRMLGQ